VTDWLLGTLLATSGLIVLVLLVREPVRRHFGSRVAYGLWLIPAARLLMPPLTQTMERTVPESAPLQPFVPQVLAEPKLLASVPVPEASLVDQVGGWPTVLLVLWLGVALGVFLARMNAFYRERSAILSEAVELGRIGSIRVIESREVRGPLAFGILDRVIAVPADFDRAYNNHERRLALEHELAHHRSGDLIANLFAFILLCLQWFNPLAWVAHAAFRFDQEAACDARVLDKAKAHDRADYGRAIAKAASGRTLLFASALDRRNTLRRRLKSMLSNPTAGRRLAGRLMVVFAVAGALPLTATRAINYVDVPAPAPTAPGELSAPAAAPAPIAAIAPLAPIAIDPAAPADPVKPLYFDGEGMIMVNGQSKRWKDLTAAEKDEARRSIVKAKQELVRSRIDREEIRREIRQAMAEVKIDKDEIRRDMAEARADVEQAVREIDAHAPEIRLSGQDPEQLKATVRVSLKGIGNIDVEAITRQALASVDQRQIEASVAASVAAAEAGIRAAEAELNRLEKLDRDD